MLLLSEFNLPLIDTTHFFNDSQKQLWKRNLAPEIASSVYTYFLIIGYLPFFKSVSKPKIFYKIYYVSQANTGDPSSLKGLSINW